MTLSKENTGVVTCYLQETMNPEAKAPAGVFAKYAGQHVEGVQNGANHAAKIAEAALAAEPPMPLFRTDGTYSSETTNNFPPALNEMLTSNEDRAPYGELSNNEAYTNSPRITVDGHTPANVENEKDNREALRNWIESNGIQNIVLAGGTLANGLKNTFDWLKAQFPTLNIFIAPKAVIVRSSYLEGGSRESQGNVVWNQLKADGATIVSFEETMQALAS